MALSRHDGESGYVWQVEFAEHELRGPGIPVPGEVRVTYINDEGEVVRRLDTVIDSVMINEEVPDSAFEIDLPPGTRVTDYNLGHTYLIGEEVSASD